MSTKEFDSKKSEAFEGKLVDMLNLGSLAWMTIGETSIIV